MVRKASRAGVWGVKIQSFFADELSPKWKEKHDYYKERELSWDDHGAFVLECHKNNVVPITSVCNIAHLTRLKDLGFEYLKIGSAESWHEDLIRLAVMQKFKVFVSTGGRDLDYIADVRGIYAFFHCVSQYPARLDQANLFRMWEIKNKFKSKTTKENHYGFSDHTNSYHPQWNLPSFVASAMGASFIEKHFTTIEREKIKDGKVSIEYEQLNKLCEFDRLDQKTKMEFLDNVPLSLFLNLESKKNEREIIDEYEKRWKR